MSSPFGVVVASASSLDENRAASFAPDAIGRGNHLLCYLEMPKKSEHDRRTDPSSIVDR
jgi:hypothetical protein